MKKSIIAFSMVLAMFTGCKTMQSDVSKEGLTASKWELSAIMGETPKSEDYPGGIPNAAFTADNRIAGKNGCNQFSGPYTLDNNGGLTFGTMMSTKMFCEGSGEGQFMSTMGKVTSAKITDGKLVLLNGKEELMVFVPKKSE